MDFLTYQAADLSRSEAYHLLTALVVPRPIGWVSTVDADGVANIAPFSFFNVCSDDPPVVYFSSSQRAPLGPDARPGKDSVRNVQETGEFVASIVSADLLHQMVATSASVEPDVDEFAHVGLETAPSVVVRPPRVAAARAAIECRLHSVIPLGAHEMILGEVVAFIVRGDLMIDGRLDISRLDPVGRLAGALYATLGDIIVSRRPP